MSRRIDKTVAEPLMRMAISDLRNATHRIEALDRETDMPSRRKHSKLTLALKRFAEAAEAIADFAEANNIELRDTMAT